MGNESWWREQKPVIPVADIGACCPVTEWLVAGPFPVEVEGDLYRELPIGRADAIDADPIGCETTIRPVEGMELKNPSVPSGVTCWQRFSGSAEYNLKTVWPGADSAIAYAVAYLDVAEPTTIALWAESWAYWQNSTVQIMVDGVEVGHNSAPAVVTLEPGEHCLMLKIGGGGTSSYAWTLKAIVGVVTELADGIGVSLPRFSGFWRGPEDAPRPEVDAVLVNAGNAPQTVSDLKAALTGAEPGALKKDVYLEAGQAKAVRLAAPLGDNKPETAATITLSIGDESVRAEGVIPTLLDPCTIHIMQGFHCDPVWVSDQHHYNKISLENVKMEVDACRVDPGYVAFVHEIDYLKAFVDEYPDYREDMFRFVAEGRMKVGSSYSEPNENNCSGEAIVRNILYGHYFHRGFLGGDPTVYHCWDVFGHVPQLSQILAKSGHIGTYWSKSITGFSPVFRHMSLDGTVLPHVRSYYTWFSHSMDNLRAISEPLVREKQSYGWKRHLHVEASDFNPPCAWEVGETDEMADSYPKIIMTGPEEFIRGLEEDGARLPLTSRNPCQHHVGTQHTRVEMKLANRRAEYDLVAAETWATFATLMGAEYPDAALDKGWRQVLFGQHHDALTGTPCDMSYLDLMAGYREAVRLSGTVLQEATGFIAGAVQGHGPGDAHVVFNSLNWQRGGLVSLLKPEGAVAVEVHSADGDVLPSEIVGDTIKVLVDDIPSVGYTTVTVHVVAGDSGSETGTDTTADESGVDLSAVDADAADSVRLGATDAVKIETVEKETLTTIENEFWKITLDAERGGGVCSLFDKNAGKELINPADGVGDDLVIMRNGTNPWEFNTNGEFIAASESSADISVEETPLATTATICGRLGKLCAYTRKLRLRPGSRVIEADVEINGYSGSDHQFAVNTPVALSGSLPVFEDKFGSIVARRGKTKFDYRTSGNDRASDCAIFPVHNWMEAGWSAKVRCGGNDGSSLNLGLMGLIVPHDIALEDATETLHVALSRAGVTTTPMYDDDDIPRRKELALGEYGELFYYHLSDDSVARRLDDIAMNAQWLAISVDGSNAYVTELLGRLPNEVSAELKRQKAEQGWGLVLAEDTQVPEGWPAVPVLVLCADTLDGVSAAVKHIAAGLEDGFSVELPAGSDFRVDVQPVDDYGFGFLTHGNGAATMEPDGSITFFLGRASGWANTDLRRGLNPELRDMVYHYAYFGHEGSWRDGGIIHAGYEYANPLVSAGTSGEGTLPKEHSFLSLEGSDAVITTVKPVGNPVQRFASGTSNPADGIVVRAYDACGRGTSGSLSLASGISSASRTNLLEEEPEAMDIADGNLPVEINPFSIDTFVVTPGEDVLPAAGEGAIGPVAEEMQPVWCRYWLHNTGAHPMGYLPVGIYLEGDLPIENRGGQFPTMGNFRVWICNNHTDRSISGVARLSCPAEWRLLPGDIEYDLEPRQHMSVDVVVAYDHRPRVGLIKARMEHEGQTYQDVLEAGFKTTGEGFAEGRSVRRDGWNLTKERAPEWSALRDGDDILVRVKNPWLQPLDVEIAIISPVEMWGEDMSEYALADLDSGYACKSIPGRQEYTFRFPVTHDRKNLPRFWAWAKLMCNGYRAYKPVPGTTA